MKKILFAGIAVSALLVGPAIAADMAVKAPMRAPPPAPVASWTGCYINGGGGYGMWNQDTKWEDPVGVAISTEGTNGGRGWFGTVGAGCDYQISSNILIGAFTDFDFMDLHGTMQVPLFDVGGEEKERWAWAVGGRIGWLVTPNLLTYFNGGYTQTRFDQVDLNLLSVPNGSVALSIPAHTYNGWFLGGGTEYNFGWFPGLFWRNEYRFASYRAASLPFIVTATGVSINEGVNSEKFVQTVRTELVWRFNWGGVGKSPVGKAPVAARY